MPTNDDALTRAVEAYQRQLEQQLRENLQRQSPLFRILRIPGGRYALGNHEPRIRRPMPSSPQVWTNYTALEPVEYSMDWEEEITPPPTYGPWVATRPDPQPFLYQYQDFYRESSSRAPMPSGIPARTIVEPPPITEEPIIDPILAKLLMEHVEAKVAEHAQSMAWLITHFNINADLTFRELKSLKRVKGDPPKRFKLEVVYSTSGHKVLLVINEGGVVRCA